MEGATHRRHVGQAVGGGRQALDGGAGIGHDLARLLDEDLAHLGVFFEAGAARGGGPGRRHRGRGRRWLGPLRGGQACDLGQFAAHLRPRGRVVAVGQAAVGRAEQLRQLELVGRGGDLGQAVGLARQFAVGHAGVGGGAGQGLHLVHQRHGGGVGRHGHRQGLLARRAEGRHPLGAAHHRGQAAAGGVEPEQALGQLRLHAEHVDQEAQRAEVVGQAVEGARLDGALRVDLGLRELVDHVAHVQRGLRGLVHAQHRQHAAHGAKLRRHRDEHRALGRVAEILVDVLLDLGQAGAQLGHHAAHGLAVGDAAVQRLHPHLQRPRLGAVAHGVDAAGQVHEPLGQVGLVELAVLQRGVQEQGRGRHFHGQPRGWRRRGGHHLRGGGLQRPGQHLAGREQLLQRLAHQVHLVDQRLQPVQLAGGHGRPGVLCGGHALARLHDQGRIEAAQAGLLVVQRDGGRAAAQAPGLADGGQARHSAGLGLAGAGAEEEQVLRQPVGRRRGPARGAGAQLRQQPRGHALAVDVSRQQAAGLGLEHGRGQLPQRGLLEPGPGARTGGQLGAEIAHAPRRAAGVPQQRQHLGLDHAARLVVGAARLHRGLLRQLAPLEVGLPEVGRVDAVGAGELQRVAVLREQHQRADALARQQPRQVVEQAEGHALDDVHRLGVDERRLGHQALHRALGGAQHGGHGRQAHELERTHALVQLRARLAQHRRVDGVDVAAGGGLGILEVATQRLGGVLERPPQLAVHPGQRAQVIARHRVEVDGAGVLRVWHGRRSVAVASGVRVRRS